MVYPAVIILLCISEVLRSNLVQDIDYRDDYRGITQLLHSHARIEPQNKPLPFLQHRFHFVFHSYPIILRGLEL